MSQMLVVKSVACALVLLVVTIRAEARSVQVSIPAHSGGDIDVSTVGGSGIPLIIRSVALEFLFTSFIRPIHWFYSKTSISEAGAQNSRTTGFGGNEAVGERAMDLRRGP